ncbi:BnaC08g46430D [Brassica napus]|uniref:BnaC08g46430D protein n=1 Tax=Brassica napus TaxID=3708 RepID=A0A078JJI0_BRANA|nr:BnaC08g46430D [Brassica napus]
MEEVLAELVVEDFDFVKFVLVELEYMLGYLDLVRNSNPKITFCFPPSVLSMHNFFFESQNDVLFVHLSGLVAPKVFGFFHSPWSLRWGFTNNVFIMI